MDWVIDLDISGFFDNLDHELVMKAVKHHTDLTWLHLYVQRWLKAPLQLQDGTLKERTAGTPQGGVVSPLLANLFMHHAFDDWIRRNHPGIKFERYADDALIHCESEAQAERMLEVVRQRLRECGLELHPTKTKVVYCEDDDRRQEYDCCKFDFLGYTFQPRRAKNYKGEFFVSFLPAMSNKAAKSVRQAIRDWRLASTRNNQPLEVLAQFVNPIVQGWMNYYGRFYRSRCVQVLRHINDALMRWAMRKYKRLHRRERAAVHWLGRIAQRDKHLFVLWRFGITPAAGQ
jgi:group II intron reverse transcriptase/maturase